MATDPMEILEAAARSVPWVASPVERRRFEAGLAALCEAGWSSCGCPGADGIRLDGWHTGTGWRPGIVLDPFGGSGTTLQVATGMSRHAIGIDINEARPW